MHRYTIAIRRHCMDASIYDCNTMSLHGYIDIRLQYDVIAWMHRYKVAIRCHCMDASIYDCNLKSASKIRSFKQFGCDTPSLWHQTASDVIKCRTTACFTDGYVGVILQSQNRETAGKMLQRTTARRKRRAAIRRRWILCSSEQSKLCLCPTESILPDKDQLALPHGRGIFLQSRKI